jgi:hypothetical protein
MASKHTIRKFERDRERHYAEERQFEAEKAQARLKGFKVASVREMAAGVLGLSPGQTKAEVGAEALGANMNRAERRARGVR